MPFDPTRGSTYVNPYAPPQPDPPKKSKALMIIIISIIVLLLVGLIGGGMVFMRMNKNPAVESQSPEPSAPEYVEVDILNLDKEETVK